MKMNNAANMNYVMLSNGLVININQVVGVQPNPDKADEFYIHTTTSQYYKISKADYEYIVKYGFCLDYKEVN